MTRGQRRAWKKDAQNRKRRRAVDPLRNVMSTDQVARELGVASSTIRAYVARDQMPPPSGRFGRESFWTVDVIRPWIDGVKRRRVASTQPHDTPSPVPLDE